MRALGPKMLRPDGLNSSFLSTSSDQPVTLSHQSGQPCDLRHSDTSELSSATAHCPAPETAFILIPNGRILNTATRPACVLRRVQR